MDGSVMGPLGLLLAAVGAAGMLFAERQLGLARQRLYADLAAERREKADRMLARLWDAVAVIAVAVGLYFVARDLGHGRAGLYVCVTILWGNAAGVAALRVRWVRAVGAGGEVTLVARTAYAQMAAGRVMFAGCAIYLLRP